jgi:uncharacterized protein YeaO (DUF488 family)
VTRPQSGPRPRTSRPDPDAPRVLQDALEALSEALWDERRLLGVLAETSRSASVERRAECQVLVERLRVAGLLRAIRVDAVARQVAVGPSPTLRQLAASVPEPWSTILDRHRHGLQATLELVASELGPAGSAGSAGLPLRSLSEVLG